MRMRKLILIATLLGAMLALVLWLQSRRERISQWKPDPQAIPRVIKAFESAQSLEIDLSGDPRIESPRGRVERGSKGFEQIVEVVRQARPAQWNRYGNDLMQENIVILIKPDRSKVSVDQIGPNIRLFDDRVSFPSDAFHEALKDAPKSEKDGKSDAKKWPFGNALIERLTLPCC